MPVAGLRRVFPRNPKLTSKFATVVTLIWEAQMA